MTNDEIEYWEKIRAVCCAAWGKAPWEFDAAWADGRVTTRNVNRAVDVALIGSPHPEILEEYLWPGTIEGRKEAEKEREAGKNWDTFFLKRDNP